MLFFLKYNDSISFLRADDKIDKVVTKIIGGLSRIEDTYYVGKGLIFLNIEAEEVTDITVSNVPSIVYFKNGHPHVYEGNHFTTLIICA
jgi:hypothetical protein